MSLLHRFVKMVVVIPFLSSSGISVPLKGLKGTSGPATSLKVHPQILQKDLKGYTQAPGGPGISGTWARPDKQGFVSVFNQNIRATIADGILTEVEYPMIDRAQTRDTQLILVVNKNQFLEERSDFENHVTRYAHSLAFHVSSINRIQNIKIEKDITIDPSRSVVLVDYDVTLGSSDTKIYILHNSATDNTAGGDAMFANTQDSQSSELLAYQTDRRGDEPPILQKRIIQMLVLDRHASERSVGFEGVNDPWIQLSTAKQLTTSFSSAVNGNVAATLGFQATSTHEKFRLALAMTEETLDTVQVLRDMARSALSSSFSTHLSAQQVQWQNYLNGLNSTGKNNEVHMLVLKSLEDKNFRGSIVAGPSIPSLPDSVEATESDYESARLRKTDANSGYRRVWIRDSFQMALGLLAGGDKDTPLNIARNFRRVQKSNGNFPQNTWVDGTESWSGFQIDQTGFPIILVARLVALGTANYSEFRPMVLAAGDALTKFGPRTGQERWEENEGLSPNSMAVACQGLMEASWLEKNFDPVRAENYASTCQNWLGHLLSWTYIDNGLLGPGYFERIEVANPVDPGHNATLFIGNNPMGGNSFPEKEIIDGGFIQWMISGLVPPHEKHFTSSLDVYDRSTRGSGPTSQGYLRYNHDGYGLGHLGKTWPLLSGERALAALYEGADPSPDVKVMMSSQTSGDMMPEQTGVSACPLGWAHAEVLIVSRSVSDRRSFYIPSHTPGPLLNQ